MDREKGFTLVELLAVIVVLGLVLTIAIPTILNVKEKTLGTLSKEQEKSLKDAGKLLGIDLDDFNTPIYNCKESSWVKTTNGVVCNNPSSGWTEIKLNVKDLVDNGYFKDDQHHCSGSVIVTKSNGGYKVTLENVKC